MLLLSVVLLGGCAAGIDHKIAYFGDKPYLVQTPSREFLFFWQWDEPSQVTDITNANAYVIDTKALEKRDVFPVKKETKKKKDKKKKAKLPADPMEALNAQYNQIKEVAPDKLSEALEECNISNLRGNNSARVNYRKHYECVVKKLAEFEE